MEAIEGGCNPIATGDGQSQRLLAQHVQAGLEGILGPADGLCPNQSDAQFLDYPISIGGLEAIPGALSKAHFKPVGRSDQMTPKTSRRGQRRGITGGSRS